jgi:hypothetical protein
MSIDQTIKQALAKSRRINAVVLMLERTWIRPDGNRSLTWGQVSIPNEHPRVWVPDLQDWVLGRDQAARRNGSLSQQSHGDGQR